MTNGRHLLVALADVSRVDQMKGYSISNGSVVVLMHADARPVTAAAAKRNEMQ